MVNKMSNKLIAAGLLSIGALAGCSSASGPTFNANQIQTANGAQVYRVECHGLFEGVAECVKQAQAICGDTLEQAVTLHAIHLRAIGGLDLVGVERRAGSR